MLSQLSSRRRKLLVEAHWRNSGNMMSAVPIQAMVTGWLLPHLWAFGDQLVLDQM